MGNNGSKCTSLPTPHRPGTYRSLSLYTATFNVADQGPCPDNLSAFCGVLSDATTATAKEGAEDGGISNNNDALPDIIALGLQVS